MTMREEKVILYTILTNFSVSSLQAPEDIKNSLSMVNRSLNGILLEFYDRVSCGSIEKPKD